MSRLGLLSALAALSITAACGSVGNNMSRGITAYEQGDYPAAMNAWNELNGLEDDMSANTRTRYLLYRGLTYYALGVRHYALMYLSRGRREYGERKLGFLDDKTLEEVDRELTDLLHTDR